MVRIRELLGTISLAGLLYLPVNSQEIPKNFKPVGIIESKEDDKNNNGVQDNEEKVIKYNNSVYKYFRVYHKETKKQTYFIADKDYKLIRDTELYYHLFSVITINESAKKAKEQNFEKHLSEWASDYEKIKLGILTTDIAKKSMEELSKLEGLLINEHFFGGRKIPEALDHILVEGSDLIAKKRANDGFNEIINELAEGLAVENPKDIADYVLNNMQKITATKITAARKRLLIAKKRLEAYDPDKDFWSLTQAKEFVNDLVGGLEGITYAKAYLASLGRGGSLDFGAELIAENFAEGLTGASIDKIVANLTKNEPLQKIKSTIEESKTGLAKSLGKFYIALDPKQDPNLEALLLDENIVDEEFKVKDIKASSFNFRLEMAGKGNSLFKEDELKKIGDDYKLLAKLASETKNKKDDIAVQEAKIDIIKKLNNDLSRSGISENLKLKYQEIIRSINSDKNKLQAQDEKQALEDKVKNEEIKPSKTLEKGVEIEWSKKFDGTKRLGGYLANLPCGAIIGKDGSLYLAIKTSGDIRTSGKRLEERAWVLSIMKLDENGKSIWINQGGTLSYGDISIAMDKEDNIYTNEFIALVGTSMIKYDSNGKRIWKNTLTPDHYTEYGELTIDNSGHVCIIGLNKIGSIIEKYSKDGEKIWSRQFSEDTLDKIYDITTDKEDNIYVSGYTKNMGGGNKGGLDSLVAKYSKDGKKIWIKQFGTKEEDQANDIKIDKGGKLYITGSTSGDLKGINYGGGDAFLSKLDENGGVLWSRQIGTKVGDAGIESIIDKENNIYLLGHTSGTNYKSSGFIIKYNKDGDEIWTNNFEIEDGGKPSNIILDENTNLYVIGEAGQMPSKIFITKFKQK